MFEACWESSCTLFILGLPHDSYTFRIVDRYDVRIEIAGKTWQIIGDTVILLIESPQPQVEVDPEKLRVKKMKENLDRLRGEMTMADEIALDKWRKEKGIKKEGDL